MPMKFTPRVPAGRITLTTTTPEMLEELFQPYGLELGKLVYSWNKIQESLSRIFSQIVDAKHPNVATAIWHSTPSDLQQRKMLRSALSMFDRKSSPASEIIWILDSIDHSLAHKRNDAIHAPLVFITDALGTTLGPDRFTSDNPRAKALLGKDLLAEFKWYHETCDVLTRYARAISQSIRDPDRHSVPERPKLPLLTLQTKQRSNRKSEPK